MQLTAEPAIDGISVCMLVEGPSYEFKRSLNLDEPKPKAAFIDDIVAFLNTGPGHLLIGVAEKAGKFEKFIPITDDTDKLGLRITSVIQDNIIPKPLAVSVRFLAVDQGFIADVVLPEHRLRPYQNKLNGSFYVRSGAKNTPVPREQLESMFLSAERMEQDTIKLLDSESAVVEARGIGPQQGAALHIAIIPQEHYNREFAPFHPGDFIAKQMRPYHQHRGQLFVGSNNGFEVSGQDWEGHVLTRFFISNTWLIHSYIAHPFTSGDYGLRLDKFQDELARHLRDIVVILNEDNVRGPFSIMLSVKGLKSNPKLQHFFPIATQVDFPRPIRVESIDGTALASLSVQQIRGVARGGW